MTKTAIIDLQYADLLMNVPSLPTLQKSTSLDLVTEAYQSLGLSINKRNTKVMHQPTPGINAELPEIKISGGILEVVEHVPYLGSHLSQKTTIEALMTTTSTTTSGKRRRCWSTKPFVLPLNYMEVRLGLLTDIT